MMDHFLSLTVENDWIKNWFKREEIHSLLVELLSVVIVSTSGSAYQVYSNVFIVWRLLCYLV